MSKKTPKTTPSRLASTRAFYTDNDIYPILDEALFCTISYAENNEPFSIPQSFVRIDNYLYLHASVGSHFVRTIADGRKCCIVVMLADELVVAKSAVSHSVNYRSVVIFGAGEIVDDPALKLLSFKHLTEKMVPGSWDYLIPIKQKDIDRTTSIRFSLAEASAKIRKGPPNNEKEEKEFEIWSGLIPIHPVKQPPIPDAFSENIPLPKHLKY